MHIAICDDNPNYVQVIQFELSNALAVLKHTADICCFTNPEQLMRAAKTTHYDLVLLDIEMPGFNGFQIAEQLNQEPQKTYIFFVSNHEKKVYEAYEYEPLWFLRKEDLSRCLTKALDRFYQKWTADNTCHEFTSGANHVMICLKEILYLKCSGHHIAIVKSNGEQELYGSLSKLEQELSDFGFLRIYKNYLVNRIWISSIESKAVILQNKCYLPLRLYINTLIINIRRFLCQDYVYCYV